MAQFLTPANTCGGFLPLGRTGLASGTLETENESGLDSGTRVEEGSDVDAGLGRVLPETGETASGESVTNEANFNENVNSSNGFTDIGITTNSGVDSGLDKGGIDGDFDGGETECGAAFRVALAPHRRLRRHLPHKGEGKREAAPTQSVGARGIENLAPRGVRHSAPPAPCRHLRRQFPPSGEGG